MSDVLSTTMESDACLVETSTSPDALARDVFKDVNAAVVEPSGTAISVIARIHDKARRRAVEEAILYERINRHNGAIADGRLSAAPRLPAEWLSNSMTNARRSATAYAREIGLS